VGNFRAVLHVDRSKAGFFSDGGNFERRVETQRVPVINVSKGVRSSWKVAGPRLAIASDRWAKDAPGFGRPWAVRTIARPGWTSRGRCWHRPAAGVRDRRPAAAGGGDLPSMAGREIERDGWRRENAAAARQGVAGAAAGIEDGMADFGRQAAG
jgi:hypothetical protein